MSMDRIQAISDPQQAAIVMQRDTPSVTVGAASSAQRKAYIHRMSERGGGHNDTLRKPTVHSLVCWASFCPVGTGPRVARDGRKLRDWAAHCRASVRFVPPSRVARLMAGAAFTGFGETQFPLSEGAPLPVAKMDDAYVMVPAATEGIARTWPRWFSWCWGATQTTSIRRSPSTWATWTPIR